MAACVYSELPQTIEDINKQKRATFKDNKKKKKEVLRIMTTGRAKRIADRERAEREFKLKHGAL